LIVFETSDAAYLGQTLKEEAKMKKKLGILFAAFEAVPFVKTGGLGDVAGSLPGALNEDGCDVRVVLPKLSCIPQEYRDQMKHVTDFTLDLSWRKQYCGIETLRYQGVDYYFIDNEYYFFREAPYGYYDDGERMAFFSKAVVECIGRLPDFDCRILHCNDWHTALAPVFLRELYRDELHDRVRTVFSVHNLKFQGQMSDYVLGDILGLYKIKAAAEQLRSDASSINFVKGALCYSDRLSTVSPSYAQEVTDPLDTKKILSIPTIRITAQSIIMPERQHIIICIQLPILMQ